MEIVPMEKIVIPKKLASLIQAFSADEQSARCLVSESLEPINDIELDYIIDIIRQLSPKNTIQLIHAAQFVICHRSGLRLLNHEFVKDKKLGLKLLRFSNEAMSKFCGGHKCQ